jgi:hypothetical protein
MIKNTFLLNFKQISISLLFVLTGFSFGNFFGINSKLMEKSFFLILLLICLIELITFLQYGRNEKSTLFFFKHLNTFKRGFLIGIFVEAFKVGS